MAAQSEPGSAKLRQLSEIWEEDNKIVVGIDIGTTQSAVALTYLARGEKQEIHRIAKWPGQGEQDQRAKIPTVIWYNLETKKPQSFGAEAMSRDGKDTAEDNGWFLVKHFKLHLQPEDQRKDDIELDPLPAEIPLTQIYSDFMGYLLKHTKAFVEKRIPLGKQIWEKYKHTMEVVIAHPNGWDTPEQDFLRKAAVHSGFVDPDKAVRQVQFVTEAEASVHFCIHHSSLGSVLQPGTNLAVCDAGGSTVDTTLYLIASTTPVLQLREAQISDSAQVGGIFVNAEFDSFMRRAFRNLRLNSTQVEDFTAAAVEDFENFAKRNYDGPGDLPTGSETVSIQVANTSFNRDSSTHTKIHRGRMKIPSSAIKKCFDVSVKPILSSVGEQLKDHTVQYVLLVGGFGDSPYLQNQFESHFNSDDRQVLLANESTSKAVAVGSVIWNTLGSVIARTPRRSFGMICAIPHMPWIEIAGGEGRTAYIGPPGVPMIPGKWAQIVKKGVPLDAETIFRENYKHITTEPNPTSMQLSMDFISYSGDDEPMWAWDKNENLRPKFKQVCTINAHIWDIEGALQPAIGITGIHYRYMLVDVCICFGTTELRAHLEWEQNGVRRKGPATVVSGRPIDL
ncbi:unnamed protein product [Rhizoctonia solani]|uniref:Heat shock 70 kDa protein 12A n=1 Tax=Rhizoctonia solani TaxID=456999 RepID=A0A8H3HGN1_9AGAM|nr:unnamed protein product [Rhizoctonia solani]